jgi:hypothetical protein
MNRAERFALILLILASLFLAAVVGMAADGVGAEGGRGAGANAMEHASASSLSVCGGHGHRHGLVAFEGLLARAWEKGGDPYADSPLTDGQQARLRHHRTCSRPGTLDEMRDRAAEARQSWKRWSERIQFRDRYTPYFFGEPTLRWVAVPPYIIECETNGYYGEARWGALNGSGHGGPYQIDLSLHGAPWPASYPSARREHHRIAAELWNGGAGASHWSCS